MSEAKNRSRALSIMAVLGMIAFLASVTYFIIVLTGRDQPIPETPQQRAARCAAAPSGEKLLYGDEMAPLAEANALAEGGKIKVVFTNGATIGLELFQIRPESLYDRAGLCDGDIVTSVGGIRLDTPEATLDAYEQLRGQKLIGIELLRRGSAASYRVRVE